MRFLDNFSAGTRGSASAEYFLRSGKYAVIFMHRQHSLQPFSRHYSHTTNPFLDLLDIGSDVPAPHPEGALFPSPMTFTPSSALPHEDNSHHLSNEPPIRIDSSHEAPMLSLLRSYKLVRRLDLLHSISFVTVHEYLFLLRGVAKIIGTVLKPHGRRGMCYLAAAVSDFFVSQQKMVNCFCFFAVTCFRV